MKLKGERIVIRDLRYSDQSNFYEYGKDPKVGPMAGWKPFPSREVSDRMLTANMINREMFAITLEDKLIGTISLYNKPYRKYNKAKTLGFSLRSDYWNQGIMTEAVKLMIEYVFTKTDCLILEVAHHVGNYASKRVIEKCGFNYDGRFNKYKVLYDERVIDVDFYSMEKIEYERMYKHE